VVVVVSILIDEQARAIKALYQDSSQIIQIMSKLRLRCPRSLTRIESLSKSGGLFQHGTQIG